MNRFFRNVIGLLLILIMPNRASLAQAEQRTAYDFSFRHLTGNKRLDLRQFEGRVILLVNTASNCGFTKQYEALEKIYNQYKESGLVIVGVPSNDFGAQEPGSEEEIASFCKLNFGVTFPMTSKEVVSGNLAHPFYKWARQTLGFGTAPKWNFHKYLIDRQGNLVDYFNSITSPESKKLKEALERLLNEKHKS